MEPFQIVYLSSSDKSADVIMDEYTLERITETHLTETLRAADNNFVSLSLYHAARSDVDEMFQNGTKVGFGGSITYASSEDDHSMDQMISSEYLSFLGGNETRYVALLRAMGWPDLERALLMSALGHMVELVDGDMVERDDDDASGETDDAMEKNMSMSMYLVAGLVPLSVIVLMTVFWLAYRARHHVTWKAPKASKPSSDPTWQSHHPKSASLRQAALAMYRDAENGTADDTSRVSADETSVRVTVSMESTRSPPAAAAAAVQDDRRGEF